MCQDSCRHLLKFGALQTEARMKNKCFSRIFDPVFSKLQGKVEAVSNSFFLVTSILCQLNFRYPIQAIEVTYENGRVHRRYRSKKK